MATFRILFVFLFSLLIFGCSSHPVSTWAQIEPKELPGVVALVKRTNNGDYRPKCSGVLIKPEAVLTAAHCIDDLEPEQIGIIYNCQDIYSSKCRGAQVVATVRQDAADVGLLLLDRIPENIEIAQISKVPVKEDQHILIAGYGTRGRLKMGVSKVYAATPFSFISDFNFRERPEHGDSGGPAYSIHGPDLKVVAVTSAFWIQEVDDIDGPTEYHGIRHTDVTIFNDWIESNYQAMRVIVNMGVQEVNVI